jgi:RES domain-containing protein
MADGHGIRDSALIDALEDAPSIVFEGAVWRVVREGRDVLQCSSYGGRWDDGTFDVLYTSTQADGAIAEMHFHLSRGQPVMPSKVDYYLYELRVAMQRALKFSDLAALATVGMDAERFGALSYIERVQEYPRPQEIAEVAQFVGFDGLIVPSARLAECLNAILFCDRIPLEAIEVVRDRGAIRWDDWRNQPPDP